MVSCAGRSGCTAQVDQAGGRGGRLNLALDGGRGGSRSMGGVGLYATPSVPRNLGQKGHFAGEGVRHG
jgi:hypothetical protein